MSDIVLSYAPEDHAAAALIARFLADAELSVDHDCNVLVTGARSSGHTRTALWGATSVMVLLSRHAQRRGWLDEDLQSMLRAKRCVVPVLLDDEAKHNWIWPLLADRRSFELDPQSRTAGARAAHIVESMREALIESTRA